MPLLLPNPEANDYGALRWLGSASREPCGGREPPRAGGRGQTGDYQVSVRSPSWIAPKEVEVWIDGALAQTLSLGASLGPGPGRLFEVTAAVAPTSSRARHYVVFHARGDGDLSPVHPG